MASYTLYASNGTGSVMIEALLTLAKVPFELKLYSFKQLGPGCKLTELLALNPLAQIPTLVLPDGTVMSESAAIAVYLTDTYPESGLGPAPDHPHRPLFLRWLNFLGSALYATFTYGDFPARWVDGEEAGKSLVRHTDAHRESLWRYLDTQSRGPFFLGKQMTALDIFVAMMTQWTPKRPWFEKHCPNLHAISVMIDQNPELNPLIARNFET